MNRPGALLGALVGLLLTLPLIIVSGLANQLLGLPFIPYDLFPFIRDVTPGAIITFVIDTMVQTITALNLGRVDTVAKTAEQAMSIGMLLVLCIIVVAVFFWLMNALRSEAVVIPGTIFGLLFGGPIAYITRAFGTSSTTGSSALDFIWVLVLFIVWGILAAWAYQRLNAPVSVTNERLTA